MNSHQVFILLTEVSLHIMFGLPRTDAKSINTHPLRIASPKQMYSKKNIQPSLSTWTQWGTSWITRSEHSQKDCSYFLMVLLFMKGEQHQSITHLVNLKSGSINGLPKIINRFIFFLIILSSIVHLLFR